LVIRDGNRKRIAGREVARGDLVVLSEGDRVPADPVLIQCNDLQTDESLLTGESVPVRKVANSDPGLARAARPGGDDQPFVFSGSLVVRGSGVAQVIATGPRSEIGKIGQSLSILEREPPRLQVETRRVVQVFAFVGAVVCVLAIVLYGLSRGDWLLAVLAGIALGMSMLPEEFPVVLTVFMAMGAWRISRARVLTRTVARDGLSGLRTAPVARRARRSGTGKSARFIRVCPPGEAREPRGEAIGRSPRSGNAALGVSLSPSRRLGSTLLLCAARIEGGTARPLRGHPAVSRREGPLLCRRIA